MTVEWTNLHHEEAGLRMRHPSEWRCLRDLRDLPVTLLAPVGASDFRSSLVVATEPAAADADLDAVVRGVVRELDRFLTDYRNTSIDRCHVAEREARRVTGTYRSGRVEVSIDQWLVDVDDRLISFTASYDPAHDPEFGTLAAEVVRSLKLA